MILSEKDQGIVKLVNFSSSVLMEEGVDAGFHPSVLPLHLWPPEVCLPLCVLVYLYVCVLVVEDKVYAGFHPSVLPLHTSVASGGVFAIVCVCVCLCISLSVFLSLKVKCTTVEALYYGHPWDQKICP